jgi:hypothetical protein
MMMNRPKTEAGLRANDPAELPEGKPADDEKATKTSPRKSEMDEASAESGPELRDIPIGDRIDRAEGNA